MSGTRSNKLNPSSRVLATLNPDGSRFWIKPRVSAGRFWHARRVVAYALILLFAVLPHLTINGKPAVLLDIVHRRFTLFGTTFMPTDTVLMAVLMLGVFLTIFLVTALFGRVWCGWACPQTVYMEFLYRPIERLCDGAPGSRRAANPSPLRTVLKYGAFFACSCYLANVFLSYFVGFDQLKVWVTRSPLEHPASFAVMAATVLLMMFDFSYFREQTCLVACPYGRFQSALTDRHSMIISYDRKRGEPRGKPEHAKATEPGAVVSLPVAASGEAPAARGDCVDCHMCVTTCPTGIDIRNGLQMECIGCAQCIDACDAVMDKVGTPRGLIRYSSAAVLDGEARHIIRPRTLLYPVILLGIAGLFVYLLITRPPGEAAILPRQGAPFYALPEGPIANQMRLRLVNRGETPAPFSVSLTSEAEHAGVTMTIETNPVVLQPTESVNIGFVIAAPVSVFSERGAYETAILVTDGSEFRVELPYRMLGPANRASAVPATKE